MLENASYYVTLEQLIKEFNLEVVYAKKPLKEYKVTSAELNRPGLPLAGFFDYFDDDRIQILGNAEYTFLSNLSSEERYNKLNEIFKKKIPAVIFARDIECFPELIEAAKSNDVPVLTTPMSTSRFIAAVVAYLQIQLAPRITRHGVLVEVYGEGVLMLGESGVGKSETAIELVKRGHRLVADDAVEIKRVSDKTLVGTSPEIIRHFIELRGIGIIDVRRIFGMGAIKATEKIDLVINLEPWQEKKSYDRLGLVTEYMDILDLKVPSLTIPVKPGRNLAIVVEVAAMNNRQKKMGYNPAQELNDRLMKKMEEEQNLMGETGNV
ncbi:MAG: HPr(Ser) kinase/phosphatase [Clostridia bacterium]|nr:HPr(Ser) kinase/phosphatase [Clostridia bacterium]